MPSISRQLQGWGRQSPPVGRNINGLHPLSQRLNASWLLNEGCGSPRDLVSHKSGTLVNSPTWTRGPFGGPAMNFVLASTQYITLPTPLVFNNNSAGTVSVWFKTIATVDGGGILYGEANTSSANPLAWIQSNSLTAGNVRFVVRDSALVQSDVETTGKAYNDGRWHHAVGVSTGAGGTLTLYMDGGPGLSASNTTSATMPLLTSTIGAAVRPTITLPYDGQIAIIKTWPRALSAAEVISDYQKPFEFIQTNTTIKKTTTVAVGLKIPIHLFSTSVISAI